MSLLKPDLRVSDRLVFWGFGFIVIASIAASLLRNNTIILAIPFAITFILLLLTNYQVLYYLLIFALPFSMEVTVSNGLTTDLPSEPLMLTITACFLGSLALGAKPDKRFFSHPIIVLIGVMYLWAVVTTFFSTDVTKSIKYLLAKAWYITPFLLFTGTYIKSVTDIRKLLWLFLLPLSGLVVLVIFKHALLHFAFHEVQHSVDPFFKNHVIYAATLALFVPYIFTLFQLENKKIKVFLLLVLFILLCGIGFSYTRASWISIPLAGFYYVAIRFKLTRFAVIGAYLGAIVALGYMVHNNNFMLYAPDYEKTIFNRDNLEKHLQATYKLEDVSGMERVYRWVAAINLAADKPVFGCGPNSFYPEYKKYTVYSFHTYVSDNPEHSTSHNYFLLQLAEQGVIGLVLFMILIGYLLILPQTLYHRTKNPQYRAVIIGAGLCLLVIVFHLTLNELVEVDKIGAFYYISIALLIKLDIWTKEEKQAAELLN